MVYLKEDIPTPYSYFIFHHFYNHRAPLSILSKILQLTESVFPSTHLPASAYFSA